MKNWPLKFTVYAAADVGGVDYADVEGAKQVPGVGWSVPVFAYEVTRSAREWSQDLGVFLLRESLLIYCPPGRFSDGQQVGATGALGWQIDGNAVDANANPYWSPGLVTYVATRSTVAQ